MYLKVWIISNNPICQQKYPDISKLLLAKEPTKIKEHLYINMFYHYKNSDDKKYDRETVLTLLSELYTPKNGIYVEMGPASYVSSINVRELTHWGRVTHICDGKLSIIGSDNVLSPGQCHYLN